MKKNKLIFFIFTLFLCFLIYYAFHKQYIKENDYDKKESIFSQEDIKTISESLAHLIASDLSFFSPYYDFNKVVSVLSEIERGNIKLLPSDECRAALMDFEYKILEKEQYKNLEKANQFLTQLTAKINVVEVDKGKLYYEILRNGSGTILTEDSVPLIHFTESDLSGTMLQDTRGNHPKKIPLKETIPGFRKGVIGMRVGERRMIYVHPDLAYGKVGRYSQQELIVFDVEILEL